MKQVMTVAERVACVLPSPPRAIFDKASTLDNVVDLTLGDPDLPPPLNVRQAACDAIMAGKTRYSANAGLFALREAIAKDVLARSGQVVDPATEIIVTVGAMEASFLSLYTLLEPGDEVVIQAPYWINYSQVVRSLGAIPIFVNTRPEDGFRLRPEALEAVLTPRTKLVVLNYPNNPSGAIVPLDTLKAVADLAQKRDFMVLTDEIYEFLIYDGVPHASIWTLPGMRERTILINGLSKRYAMTGWRLGWAIAPAHFVAQMTKMQENIVACAPLPAQYAALEALSPRTDNTYILNEFQKRRDVLVAGINRIPRLKCMPVQATFYALVDVSETGMDGKAFAFGLLDAEHVAVVYGSAYGGETYDNFVRIAFTRDVSDLEEALRRIERYVACLP